MSLFGPTIKYSQHSHSLTAEGAQRLMWSLHRPNVSEADKEASVRAILERRDSDGKISLQRIYETLQPLKDHGVISKYDRDDFMKIFVDYFKTHFPE